MQAIVLYVFLANTKREEHGYSVREGRRKLSVNVIGVIPKISVFKRTY